MATNPKHRHLNVRVTTSVDDALRNWAEARGMSLATAVDQVLGLALGVYSPGVGPGTPEAAA